MMRIPTGSRPRVRVLFLDVDGVLTDGGMYYSEAGEVMKKFNTRDGMGIQLAREHGILPVILAREASPIVQKRGEKLLVGETHTGIQDKLHAAKEILSRLGIPLAEAAFVGDDLYDIPLLKAVALSFCPADAVDAVKRVASFTCTRRGGEGVVREVVDYLLATPR
jgi:3-deoxy-D-manno-octulosonate 8-phosphate phosphatase (KDO 8-P phosphatase)